MMAERAMQKTLRQMCGPGGYYSKVADRLDELETLLDLVYRFVADGQLVFRRGEDEASQADIEQFINDLNNVILKHRP